MTQEELENEEQSALGQQFDPKSFIETDKMESGSGGEPELSEEEKEEQRLKEEEEAARIAAEKEVKEEMVWEEQEEEEEEPQLSEEEAKKKADEEAAKIAAEEEERIEENNSGWEKLATDLDIKAESYDDLKKKLKVQKDLASKGAVNEKITALNELKALSDEALVREELKAQGLKEDEINDEIDILTENRLITSKAREVRRDLDRVIDHEKQAVIDSSHKTDATQQKDDEEVKKELTEFMSKTSKMFGGAINDKQKTDHVDYISSGKFFDEIGGSTEALAEAAWLYKYRKQILKAMESSGFEKGKKTILDDLVNPEKTRKTIIPDPETGEFKPHKFLDTDKM